MSIMEEESSSTPPYLKKGKEGNWVAKNIGTLIGNKERILECIHIKI
jgi:hypothetical protein